MNHFALGEGRVLIKAVKSSHGFIHLPPIANLHRITCQPWRWRLLPNVFTRDMKRKATDSGTDAKAKRQRNPQADYCDVIPRKDDHGNAIWPASQQSIDCAREFLKEW